MSSLGVKAARKIKRFGKNAVQFRFTSTFEYIDVYCNGTWRPDNLRIVWLRSHRRVQSIDVKWEPREDRGPNGAEGRAKFDPPLSVSLLVTLYKESEETEFDEKTYKYYIENDGPAGKKILASFTCDVAEYAGIPSTRHKLDMTFKTVSKKVNKAVLGITLESEFIKQGNSSDVDMQSTFSAISAMSAGTSSLNDDDEEDAERASGAEGGSLHSSGGKSPSTGHRLSKVPEEDAQMQRKDTRATSPPSSNGEAMPRDRKSTGAMANGSAATAAVATGTTAWLGEASFVDCFGESVSRDKLETADIIGLYFSANWCPPCRRFLPKLIKFYHHLKQHNKSFEILYVSSDYSKQDMMKYMNDQQMPWVGLAYDSSVADKLRGDFSVSAIPLFTIITRNGVKIEASAKKPVEAASNGAAVLKLYNKWHDKLEEEGGVPPVVSEVAVTVESKEKKGLFKKVKDAIGSKNKDDKNETDGATATAPQEPPAQSHPEMKREQSRQIVEGRQRAKSKGKVTLTEEMMEEREERVRYLEEVNSSLKQTNDDLNEELAELRKQLTEASSKLQQLEVSSRQLEEERRELMANLNIRGWLLKRGVKGPTANVWRRRYFRCDQGSKIYYYKSAASEGTPQGMVDLDKVVSVQEVSPAQQDKNHATFLVQCDGRTYQLQAIDEATMRKWMSAIEYLRNWRKRNADAP